LDYKYIQTASAQIRKAIGKKSEFKIEFNDLIDFFNHLKILMKQKKKSVEFLQAILNLSTPDAPVLYKELVL